MAAPADAKKPYTLADLRAHAKEADCWILVHGKVYDVTPFLDEHPGGFDIIVSNTAKDATEDFDEIGHSNAAKEQLAKYYIGEYEGGDAAPKKAASAAVRAKADATAAGGGAAATLLKLLLPLVALALAFAAPKLLSQG